MTSDTARHLVWWFLRTWSVSQVRRSNFSITGENVIFNWKKRRNRKNLFGHCVRIANLNWKLQINISRKVRASHQSINQSTGQWNNERVQLQSENADYGLHNDNEKSQIKCKERGDEAAPIWMREYWKVSSRLRNICTECDCVVLDAVFKVEKARLLYSERVDQRFGNLVPKKEKIGDLGCRRHGLMHQDK